MVDDDDDSERDHRSRPLLPDWRLRDVAARGFCSWDLSHSRHTPTIAAMAGASCAGLPVHSRHASVFASWESAPRHALSTLFAKISQQVFDFFEFVLVQSRRNKRAALKLMRKLLKGLPNSADSGGLKQARHFLVVGLGRWGLVRNSWSRGANYVLVAYIYRDDRACVPANGRFVSENYLGMTTTRSETNYLMRYCRTTDDAEVDGLPLLMLTA